MAATVEVAQALSFIALTTTSPSTAISMTMNQHADHAVKPATGPISSDAMRPSERPSRERGAEDHEILNASAEHGA